MNVLSDLLLDLYRLARYAPPDDFQQWAIEKIQPALDFDSAIWATGVVYPGAGVAVHTQFLYQQPPEMMENWARINRNDELAFQAFRQQGITLNTAICGSEWQQHLTPETKAHVERYGMAHALTTIIAEPVSGLWAGISLYRANLHRPFSEELRELKQALMPHLAEAWDVSRFLRIRANQAAYEESGRRQAICDGRGVLYNATPGFSELLRAEWPEWQGPQLPLPLLECIAGKSPRRHVGQRAVISFQAVDNMELAIARDVSPIDCLTPREHEVAALFAKGANYQEIADSLCVSPATVRNHLSHIYTKLGVSNKMEMAQVVRGD